jgi:hypothetical protein
MPRKCSHEHLKNNWKSLINYAYAYRHGLRISSAPAESGMAHLANLRMDKKQSMRWSAEGSSYGTGHACACQISAAYSATVRSLENLPDAATFKTALCAHASRFP